MTKVFYVASVRSSDLPFHIRMMTPSYQTYYNLCPDKISNLIPELGQNEVFLQLN